MEDILDPSEIALSDVMSEIFAGVTKKEAKKPWYEKAKHLEKRMMELNIHSEVNMSDDRNVMVAFKMLLKAENAPMDDYRIWWIINRWLLVFGNENQSEGVEEVANFANAMVSGLMNEGQLDEELLSEKAVIASKYVFREDFEVMPTILLEKIEEYTEKAKKEPKGKKASKADDVKTPPPTPAVSEEPTQEIDWAVQKKLCLMMLSEDYVDGELREQFEELLRMCDILL